MTPIEKEVRIAIQEMLNLAEQEGIEYETFPLDMLVGALMFVSNDLKKYTAGDIRAVLLSIRGPISIKWAQNTETGYNRQDAKEMAL